MYQKLGELVAALVVWCMAGWIGNNLLHIEHEAWWMFLGALTAPLCFLAPRLTFNLLIRRNQ